jgi:Flp pilus assembly protein TadD
MIDRSWKLQRYDRKDYSELVEFPVEIVGRDGVVRRYSFEDSIRLYQRRISFAPVRYRERELVAAELLHCKSRIEQLRRSYFQRFGWAAEPGRRGPEDSLRHLSGELAAFLCRVLRSDGRVDVRIEAVNPTADGAGTWYVTPAGARTGMLLYVYRFEGEDPEPGRERFFRQVKDLERIGHADGDTERLLAFHHTLDCAFVLSGDADSAAIVDARAGEEDDASEVAPTPWDEIVDAIRRGDHAGALRRCRQVVIDQPWHRQAYTAGALLAVAAGELVVAEELGLLGVKYFPTDAALRYYLAVAWARQGRDAEAETGAREALQLDPDLAPARLLLAHRLARRREWSQVRSLTNIHGNAEDPAVQRDLGILRLRGLIRPVAVVLAIVGALVAIGAAWGGAVVSALGAALSAMGAILAFNAVSYTNDRRAPARVEDPAVGLRRLVRRDGTALVS